MRNALAGNLSPSLTACNTKPRWPCTRWLIGALLLLAFSPQVFILELICRWPLGYWPPITVLGDLLPDFSATWSTCHPASGPRGYLLLTSSTTDDRPDHTHLVFLCPNIDLSVRVQTVARAPFVFAGERFLDQEGTILRQDRRAKAAVRFNRQRESIGRNIWYPPWGPLKKGPTRNHVRSLYQKHEEYEARNRWIRRNCAPRRGQRYHTTNPGHDACPPRGSSGITSGQRRTVQSQWRTAQGSVTSRGARSGRTCPTYTT